MATNNGKISGMPVATTLSDGSLMEMVNSAESQQVSMALLKNYFTETFTAVAKVVGDITNQQFAGGADPSGLTDSTLAIKAAVAFVHANGGGEIYMPAGRYLITDTITMPGPVGTRPDGTINWSTVSIRGEGMYVSRFLANTAPMFNKPVITQSEQAGVYYRDFGIDAPHSEDALSSAVAMNINNIDQISAQNVDIFGGTVGFAFAFCSQLYVYNCHAREAKLWNLRIDGNSPNNALGATIINSLFQVADPSGNAAGAEPANIYLNGANNVSIIGCIVDELGLNKAAGGSSLLIDGTLGGSDILIERMLVFAPGTQVTNPYYGIHITSGVTRVQLKDVHIRPYIVSPERVPTNTIKIEAGVTGVLMDNIVTEPNGGGDISDASTAPIYRNVNGVSKNVGAVADNVQNVAFASSLTINAALGNQVFVGALTGNITVNAPTSPTTGQMLTLYFVQDGTGGRTVTLNAAFLGGWSDTGNTANKITSRQYVYNGTAWRPTSAQSAWA